MNRILLLGGDSFIGRSFANYRSGFSELRIVSRIPSFSNSDEMVVPYPWSLTVESFEGIDAVFNCFGIAHRKDKGNKALFYRVNRDLAINLAKKAKQAGVRKFVQMSSIAVYGESGAIDDVSPLKSTTNYGQSKAEADFALLKMMDDCFSVALLRPPMIYGPGSPGNMVKLIELVRRLPILPFANATAPREFLCVNNFVVQAEYAIESNLSGVLLMKDTRSFCTAELVHIIADALGVSRVIIDLPLSGLLHAILPAYYRKLFGGLAIKSNITLPDTMLFRFADPVNVLVKTVEAFAR